jgi:site-specific recombinase XerD
MHVLQRLMGHHSIITTADFHLAASEDQLNQVRQAFPLS